MTNNLRRIRDDRGWTQEQAAAAIGTTRNQYVKLESGARRLNETWLDRVARAYGIDPADIIRGGSGPPVVGSIGARGLVTFDAEQSRDDIGAFALRIADASILDGWLAVVQERRPLQAWTAVGKVVVLTTPGGISYFGKLNASQGGKSLFHLTSMGGTTVTDIKVDSCQAVSMTMAETEDGFAPQRS